jgi:hypothetical protein
MVNWLLTKRIKLGKNIVSHMVPEQLDMCTEKNEDEYYLIPHTKINLKSLT